MTGEFATILAVGGRSNSLGRSSEVIDAVLKDRHRLDELYRCIFHDDAWIRMRAIDAIEKIGRQKQEWLIPYVDTFQAELASSTQPSILWHLAQIYGEIPLTESQKVKAIAWLQALLSTTEVDWIVAANCMKTLVQFTHQGAAATDDTIRLLNIQQSHASKTIVRRANKLLAEFSA